MTITKADIRLVQSLRLKKYRDHHNLFTAEGSKIVAALLPHLTPHRIYTTNPAVNPNAVPITPAEMKKISALSTPSSVLGVFVKPQHTADIDHLHGWTLALDNVQDPSNVGAIIRVCDWFGIETLLCSQHTADCYAPKAVQATMGAIARIRVLYVDLPQYLMATNLPVYGMSLTGNNVYTEELTQCGIVVLGNEGQGITPPVAAATTKMLHIPSFAVHKVSESLNVATAAAIVCSEVRRRSIISLI
jgi:TrmH family RNA methyltransferase